MIKSRVLCIIYSVYSSDAQDKHPSKVMLTPMTVVLKIEQCFYVTIQPEQTYRRHFNVSFHFPFVIVRGVSPTIM